MNVMSIPPFVPDVPELVALALFAFVSAADSVSASPMPFAHEAKMKANAATEATNDALKLYFIQSPLF